MTRAKIAIVEDDEILRRLLTKALNVQDFEAIEFESAESLLENDALMPQIDIVLSDVYLPGMSGLALLDKLKVKMPDAVCMIMTGAASLESAVDAMRKGAVDYVMKPLVIDEIVRKLERVVEHKNLVREVARLRALAQNPSTMQGLVGESKAMSRVRHLIDTVAPTNTSVLLRGETGVGKEVVAQSVHNQNAERQGAFVALNCAAIPENLIESELFGYRKGAFTGAESDRDGKFVEAAGGTIFLDEVGELNLATQAKLLRVLEDRTVQPVGGGAPVPVDVRIVSATNRDLLQMVQEGTFREDLYYRLNVLEISIPPLRERIEDIPLLIFAFIQEFNRKMVRDVVGVAPEAMSRLTAYAWPGNIRQLRNVIERAMLFQTAGNIELSHLPAEIGENPATAVPLQLDRAVAHLARNHIISVLESCGGNRSECAATLGIDRSTLYRKMREYEIS